MPNNLIPKQSIFARVAPAYFERGIPVIPLRPRSKRPFMDDWSKYQHGLDAEEFNNWLNLPQDNNIGLVLGEKSGICCVDIDTDDPMLLDNISKLLPASPWVRVGKKGCVLAFKFNPRLTTFHVNIVDEDNPSKPKPILDFLTSGTQIVLPPSIHPETKKPYASNVELLDVIDELPELPDDLFHILREAVEASGFELFSRKSSRQYSQFLTAGQRDTELTSKAGLLAYDVISGNLSLRKAFYILDGIDQHYMEKVEGDSIDIDKHKNNLVKFILEDLEARNKVLPLGWDEGLDSEFIESLGLSSEQTELPYEDVLREAKLRIEESEGETVYDTLDWVLTKLAQRSKPDNLRETELLEFLTKRAKDLISSTLKVADLKRDLKERRKNVNSVEDLDGEKLDLTSHTAVARSAIANLSKSTLLCTENRVLYKWVGSHWKEFEPDQAKLYLSTRFADLDITKRNSDFEGIYKQMLVLTTGVLDKFNKSIINVKNGLLTEEGKFLEHNPDFGATYVLPYNYEPSLADPENAPLFFKYLEDSWGHNDDYEERLNALQEVICASCLGIATKFQRAILLFGSADSGKSVLLQVVSSMFPAEAKSTISFEKMHDTSHTTGLNNKLINVVGELSNARVIEGSIFKSIIGGEPITGRYLFNEVFTLIPRAAHWAASNHLPKSSDTSKGFVRRWLIFEFDKPVPEHKKDVDLAKNIIEREIEAIFAWAIEARSRLVRNRAKLTIPKSSRKKEELLYLSVNSVKHFLSKDTAIHFGANFEIAEHELYLRFRQFMFQTVGMRKLIDMPEFSSMLAELCPSWNITTFKSKNDSVTYYKGLKVSD